MAAATSLARTAALCAALCAALLMLWGADGRAWAGPHGPHVRRSRVPRCGADCTPKAATFGHYEPTWREWPGELRPDRTFPQAIGAEPLPTPEGVKEKPLPVEPLPPEGAEAVPAGPRLPAELPPGAGEILPPGKKIHVEERSPLEPPVESPMPPEPPEGETLPRSPLEMPAEKTAPKLPLETPPAKTAPKLPLETPPANTAPKLPLTTPPVKTAPKLPLEPPPVKSAPKLPLETPPAKAAPELPQLDLPLEKSSLGAPPQPVVARRTELPAESPRPGLSGSRWFPEAGRLPTVFEAPAGVAQPAKAPRPSSGREGSRMNAEPPAVQDNAPIPVEPWAEPRPWRPEPARRADYQVPMELRPQADLSRRPFELRTERPAEPQAERPVQARFEPPVEPRVEPPVQRPVQQPLQQPVEPPVPPPAKTSQQPPGLDGYCPVRLAETEQWVVGDPRWAVNYQGHTYLTSGPEFQRRFLDNPSRYAPVLSGQDPVLALDEKTSVPGQTEFCVVYDGRLYMFSSAATLARFHQNPKRYSALVLAQAP